MKWKFLIVAVVIMFLTIQCSSDKENNLISLDFSVDETKINTNIDIISGDITTIVNEMLSANDGISLRTSQNLQQFLPACATISRVPAIGTTPTLGTTVTKTIDFGNEGCTLTNGNKLKGKIILNFTYNPAASAKTIECTFVDFYHNLRRINGTKTYIRTMTDLTSYAMSYPKFVMEMDISVKLADGRIFSRKGTRITEFFKGYDTAEDWTDNQYRITGNWTTTYPDRPILTSTITSPIIVKYSCLPSFSTLAQGAVTLERNSKMATLDYGNGDCDNTATFTYEEETITIDL